MKREEEKGMKLPKVVKRLTVFSLIALMTFTFIGMVAATETRWYIKPEYPDYAPSGMPDFDQRQADWYQKVRVPDSLAVWQHWNVQFNDWDIYYSLYNDPNKWWTISGGIGTALPLIMDTPAPGPGFLQGDDQEPAVSWYSNNYAIAVWQHWNPYYQDWDIWFARFTPGVGWTTPAAVSAQMGEDYDPAIAFDTNGYAVCIWRHRVDPNPPAPPPGWKIAYSVWSPVTLSWTPINFMTAPAFPPTHAMMPEVCLDSNHNVVAIWTDNILFPPPPGMEQVWFSWAPLPAVTPPPALGWSPPAPVTACPNGINWQKGISPDNLGNSLIDFGYPVPQQLLYAEFTTPGGAWTIPATGLTNPATNGEHPDVAFDLNNKAIAVYTGSPGLGWPQPGPIYYSYWNGLNWAPIGGSFAASAGTGTNDQFPALAFMANGKAVCVWQSSLNITPPGGPQTYDDDIFYSIYTPPYPPGAWSPAATVVPSGTNNPSGGSIPSLSGNDWYVDIASPTGSPTTPPHEPDPLPPPAQPYWTWCGPPAVANSLWWFDSEYEPGNVPPPTVNDGYSLVKTYIPGLDDHDPANVPLFIEHLAWLMDTDGQRTGVLACGTFVDKMQIGITQYLSWSGVNPLGDCNGDGIVDQTDLAIVNAAMGSRPGAANWNMAADIWPETVAGPKTADNIVDINDWNLVNNHLGLKGKFYEHTADGFCRQDFFYYIAGEVLRCQDVVLLLGIYNQQHERVYGHFVTVAGVNLTTQELLISNPIRNDFETGVTNGRSPVPHADPPLPPFTTHNNASLVSQDAWHCTLDQQSSEYHWIIEGYEPDPTLKTYIEYAVITSPYTDVHDVAVTKVEPTKTVVGQKLTCRINVTVENQGTVTETFDVTTYASTLPPGTAIEKKTIASLLPAEVRIVTFNWNTTGLSKGVYTITSIADTVLGETDTADNTCTSGTTIQVAMVGDVAGGPGNFPNTTPDGKVDIKDLAAIAKCYGANYPAPNYYRNYDLNDDNKIDIKDLAMAAKNYGKIDP